MESWIDSSARNKPSHKTKAQGFLHVFGSSEESLFKELIQSKSFSWQQESLLKNPASLIHFSGAEGFFWLIKPSESQKSTSPYGFFRDVAGSLVGHVRAQKLNQLVVDLHGLSPQEELGFLVGLDVGAYNYKKSLLEKPYDDLPGLRILKSGLKFAEAAAFSRATTISKAVNLARHLVNLPPNLLNPASYADRIRKMKFSKSMTLAIWDQRKMKTEQMNLHLAVGAGAPSPACMVHLKYRPLKKSAKKPIAFVGKGLTFDTGGLDIKPSNGMRLMKKDMGGSAAVIALAQWVDASKYPHPCDFYLGLAENSVDAQSFRPSDVIASRAGFKVEIDNTDAEGRLVLADVLDVAATKKGADEPEWIIDVATLTGAIKVALGADIAGLFSNDDSLASELTKASEQSDDLVWRMPLMQKYFANLSSNFADFKNSTEGFGGAITAALFLEKFVRGKKWAHLDIYAWSDKAAGALTSAGGSGQAVQALIQFLKNRE